LSKKGDHGFSPHLTLGQANGDKVLSQRRYEFDSVWKPFKFVVEQIYIISRTESSPFSVIYTIPLAKKNTPIINNRMNMNTTTLERDDDYINLFDEEIPITSEWGDWDDVPVKNVVVNQVSNDDEENDIFNLFMDDEAPKPVQQVLQSSIPILPTPSVEAFISKLNLNEDDLGVTLKKVASWLFHQNELGKLPKTKEKLAKSLTKMCFYKTRVDLNFIKNFLTENGYFAAHSDTYFEFHKKDIDKFKLKSTKKYQTDEDIVIEKCIKWIESRDHYPKTQTLIDKAFSQLCIVKKNFDIDEILECLREKGVINYDYNNFSYFF